MSDITVTFKNETILTMDASGTKTLQTQGKYCEDDIEVVYARPSGGGGGTPIGVQSPKESILGMMYALEHGDVKTGTFTLDQTIPNVETVIFDANDSSVLCFAIFQEGAGINNTSGNNSIIENMLWMFDGTNGYAWGLSDTQVSNSMTTLNIFSDPTNVSIRYATWSFVNGVLKCTGQYNHNAQYTPFRAGVTYRWVAW